MRGYPHTVVVQRATKLTSGLGVPVEQRDWADASERTLSRVNVQPASKVINRSTRQTARGDARVVATTWLMLTAPRSGDVDIQVGDRVVFAGRNLQVVAEPVRWPGFTGGVDHVEVHLQDSPPFLGTGGISSESQVRDVVTGITQGWRP